MYSYWGLPVNKNHLILNLLNYFLSSKIICRWASYKLRTTHLQKEGLRLAKSFFWYLERFLISLLFGIFSQRLQMLSFKRVILKMNQQLFEVKESDFYYPLAIDNNTYYLLYWTEVFLVHCKHKWSPQFSKMLWKKLKSV